MTMQDRLQDLTTAVEGLILKTPLSGPSKLREEATRLSQATSRMARVLRTAPDTVPTLTLARFVTAAQGAANTIKALIELGGHGQHADEPDHEAERDLGVIVAGLSGAAETARQTALKSLRGDIEATAHTVSAWSLSDERAIRASANTHDDLSNAYLNSGKEIVPEVETPKRSFLSFWKPQSEKPKPSHTPEPMETRAIKDDEVERLMTDPKSNEIDQSRHFSHKTTKLINPLFESRGVFVIEKGWEITFSLLNTPPSVPNPMWDLIAEAMAGDAKSLSQAMHHKDSPDFQTALQDEMVYLLNGVERKANAGAVVPHKRFRDPILGAAICATLAAMDRTWNVRSGTVKNEAFDPFRIRKGLAAVMDKNDGIKIETLKGRLMLLTEGASTTPTGVSAVLNETVKDFKAQLRNAGADAFKEGGSGIPIRLRPEIETAQIDVAMNIRLGALMYGNGFTGSRLKKMEFQKDASGEPGLFRIVRKSLDQENEISGERLKKMDVSQEPRLIRLVKKSFDPDDEISGPS